jgi:hypothetical protein
MPELSLYTKQPADAETASKQAELTRLQAQVDQLQADRDPRRAGVSRHPSS